MKGKYENLRVSKLFGDNESLSLSIRDWETDYIVDMHVGNGFDITEPASRKVKGVPEKTLYGSHSKLFGTDFDDEDGYAELYRCNCGHLKGTRLEGEVCPECNTPVQYIGVNMKMTGWISLLSGQYFIHPICYLLLEDLMSKNEFVEIIKFDMDITRNGNIVQKEHKNPFYGIGITAFRKRFKEIMSYHMKVRKKDKKKLKVINKLIEFYDTGILFQRRVPIFSSMLRDSKITSEQFFFPTIDKKINMIYSQIALLNGWKSYSGVDKKLNKLYIDFFDVADRENKNLLANEYTLYELQKYIKAYWDEIYKGIGGKEGLIKDGIMGGRVNFSARDVIVPDPTLKCNQIKVGYVLFLELFKFELIQLLVRHKGITFNEAFEQWSFASTHFDESIWLLMNHYISKTKPMVILNRNPSINFGSLMLFYLDHVERGYDESFVLRIPITVLRKFNADFDGDRLNLQSVKIKKHQREFEDYLEPRRSMQISRINGKFDRDMFLIKDQTIGLHLFNSI